MSNRPHAGVAFFVDADNLSSRAIDEAFAHLHKAGAFVPMRRAFGGLEKLSSIKDVLRKHAIQGFVNQGKGTTDVALVVDVMDLLHRGTLPATVAIGSSDADFAPLAVRLREAGLRVICFAQSDNSADGLPRTYDDVFFVDSTQPSSAALPQHPVAPVVQVRNPAQHPPLPSAAATPPFHAPVIGSRPKSAGVSTPPIASAPIHEDVAAVKRILLELPGWLPNTIRQLNQLGAPLRESGIKKGHSPLYELFRKHPTYFKVLPMNGPPKQVRLLKMP